ncbi:aldo/keto reductase [Paenibacillus agricola]|uniref:Aldo/keto reductase n=1 Tax=Paenibacillus agricola TaxID=2716264 RepID=A0ABX0JBV2_9BACL|nr:aldo/keto reductase [Paenibacillus agricola]NHN33632.1 aldo/keto reductase [Paenibacillus agricola]
MRYQSIPGTNLTPSVICLGTSSLGSILQEAEAFRLMDLFYDLGGTFIDTAKVYADWLPGERSVSEKTIGRWLKARGLQNRVLVETKGGHPELHTMHIPRLDAQSIALDVETSLINLQLDCLDLYYLHRDDLNRSVAELVDVMEEQVKLGKIRYYACSNWTPERIEEANQYARKTGSNGFVANQPKWSLAVSLPTSDPTRDTMDIKGIRYHEESGLAAVPYSSQAKGFFSGTYTPEALRLLSPNTAKVKTYCTEENIIKLERIMEVSERLQVSGSQVALACLMVQSFPVFPIIGSKTAEQLTDSCSAAEVQMDPQTAAYIMGE